MEYEGEMTGIRYTRFIEHLEPDYWQCEQCEEKWVVIDGTPTENNYRYCPGCGCKISEFIVEED